MSRWIRQSVIAGIVAHGAAFGCAAGSTGEADATESATTTFVTGIDLTDAVDEASHDRLDLPPPEEGEGAGCTAVDLLFVLDNSASMQTHHAALAAAFPGFIAAIFERLPGGTDIHVGITTTDVACKGAGCGCEDSTLGCQTTASAEAILSVYAPPAGGSNGVEGSQGRLMTVDGVAYFATDTLEDPSALAAWFAAAAASAGEDGCSFEMPAAAAGFVADPANAGANAGFLRDEGTALIVFVLTDEPDKSPEAVEAYAGRLRAAKAGCGGDVCITTAAILPACVAAGTQSLWRFLGSFGEPPIWGDIGEPAVYAAVVEDALTSAVTRTCADVPVL